MDENELTVRERIAEIRRIHKWTENSLAPDAATQKRLNRQLSHGGTITLDTLLLILKACPEVSADWLLSGRGRMHLSETLTPVPATSDNSITLRFISLLEQKDQQIARLLTLLERENKQLA